MGKTSDRYFDDNGIEITAHKTPEGNGWSVEIIVPEDWQDSKVTFSKNFEGTPVVEINKFRVCFGDSRVKVCVEIPEGVEKIGYEAFKKCSALTGVVIPTSVKTIAGSAFGRCLSLRQFEVAEKNPNYKSVDGALLTKDGKTLLKGVVRDDGTAVIPDCVEKINKGAFYYYDSLKSAVIPQGVREIDDSAFYACKSLKSVEIPTSVERIGSGSFASCFSLESVEIPANVKEIEEFAFDYNNSLQNIVISNGVKKIGFKAFGRVAKVKKIVIPASVEKIDFGAFVRLPASIKFEVAEDNSNYRDVDGALLTKNGQLLITGVVRDDGSAVLPNGVIEIADRAFDESQSLKSVEIPASVKVVGKNAFSKCDSLTSVVIPSSVEKIEVNAFYACSSITTIDIFEGVKEIGARAFMSCDSLTRVTIPSSVERIGVWAFPNHKSTTICGTCGSEAEKYSKENKVRFEPLS